MYNISEEIKTLWKGNHQKCSLSVVPTTGSEFVLREDSVFSLAFKKQCLSGNDFEIGSACCSQLEVKIYGDGTAYTYTEGEETITVKMSDITWEGAQITASIGVEDEGGEAHYIQIGVFTVDEQPKMKKIISVTALDNMVLFDKTAENLSSIWSTCTIKSLVEWCCMACGVTLDTTIGEGFPNYTYHPSTMPEDEMTYRSILVWCCEIMNRFAQMNGDGHLEIKAVSTTSSLTLSDAMLFSSDTDRQITVTGIGAVINEEEIVSGTEGYVIMAEGNLLIQDDIFSTMDLKNFYYTPFTAQTLPIPYMEPLDCVTIDSQRSFISSISFEMNGACNVEAVGESSTRKGYATMNPFTSREKEIIRRAERVTNTRLQSLLKTNEMVANSFGLYTTEETLEDGSVKIYMHDRPSLEGDPATGEVGSEKVFTINDGAFAWTDSYNGSATVWNTAIDFAGDAMFKFISACGMDVGDTSTDYHIKILPNEFSVCKGEAMVMQIYAGGSSSASEVAMAIPKIVIDNPSTDEKDGYLEIGAIRIIPYTYNSVQNTGIIYITE